MFLSEIPLHILCDTIFSTVHYIPYKEWTGQHDAEGDLDKANTSRGEGRTGTHNVSENSSCFFFL